MSKADSFNREEKKEGKREKGRAGQGRDGKGREKKKKIKMSMSDSFSIKFCSFSSAQSVLQPPSTTSLTQQELIKRSAKQEWVYQSSGEVLKLKARVPYGGGSHWAHVLVYCITFLLYLEQESDCATLLK